MSKMRTLDLVAEKSPHEWVPVERVEAEDPGLDSLLRQRLQSWAGRAEPPASAWDAIRTHLESPPAREP